MVSLLLLILLSGSLTLLLTPYVRRAALARGWVDHPDRIRKLHAAATPRLGGAAIIPAALLSFLCWAALPLHAAELVPNRTSLLLALAPLAGAMFLLGLYDDLRGLRAGVKFALQAAISLAAYASGIQLTSIAGLPAADWLSAALTVFWLLLCTNAFNLIDGMDGLASSLALVASITVLAAAVFQGNLALALAVAPFIGSLAAFLRYNRPPASIFLGDCGSLTLGFLLGVYALVWSQKSATLLALAAPFVTMSIPLLDTALAVLRRFLRGDRIFAPDHGHLHHQLLSRGLSPGRALLVLSGAALLAALTALFQSAAAAPAGWLALLLFGAALWHGVNRLGYVELDATGRWLGRGGLRRSLRQEIALESFRREMRTATSVEECWQAVNHAAEGFGYGRRTLRLLGAEYSSGEEDPGRQLWTVSIPLSAEDRLELGRVADLQSLSLAVGAFAEAAAEELTHKRGTFETHAAPVPLSRRSSAAS